MSSPPEPQGVVVTDPSNAGLSNADIIAMLKKGEEDPTSLNADAFSKLAKSTPEAQLLELLKDTEIREILALRIMKLSREEWAIPAELAAKGAVFADASRIVHNLGHGIHPDFPEPDRSQKYPE